MCVVESRGLFLTVLSPMLIFAPFARTGARAAAPDPCAELPGRCDYASGAGCPNVAPETRALAPFGAETLDGLAAWAEKCSGAWDGKSGCYESHIRKDVDALVDTSHAVADAYGRVMMLPEAARGVCETLEPARAQDAIDEAPAWCVVGRKECVDALHEARRVLDDLPTWVACVGRMEAYVAENERRDGERNECEASKPKFVEDPTRREIVIDEPPPTAPPQRIAQRPAPLEITRAPGTPSEVEYLDLSPQPERSVRPDTTTEKSVQPPPAPAPNDHRKGAVELAVAPFSGLLTIRDPGTKAEYRPMMATLGLGLAVDIAVSPDIALELGLRGRGAFASSALGQAVTLGLDQLDVDTGTAFVFDLEPTVTLVSQYVGVGIVSDFRWDTIGITSATTGLVSTKSSGGAAGLRLLLGLNMLSRDLRLVGSLDWLFISTEDTVLRAAIQAELGAFVLTGAYRQHFRLGAATEAYIVDDMQLTLGYRMVF